MNVNSIAFLAVLVSSCSFATPPPEAEDRSTTVPFVLDHKRLTVEVVFKKPDGSIRAARAWVDTGGTKVVVSEQLAKELDVDIENMPAGSEHSFSTTTPVYELSLGGMSLDTEGMNFSVHPGPFARPGVQAECTLPPRCLKKYHVVFDYPAQELTLARPGSHTPKGTAVPCRVNPETGLFMVQTTIDNEPVSMGVDTGSSGTWVSTELTETWLERHSTWPRARGSAGSTNFFGFPFETEGTLMTVPSMSIGDVTLDREVALLGLDQSMFDWYTKKSAAPVSGFLGADLIANFRLEVDFEAQMTWWQPGPTGEDKRDLNIVGITLRAESDGTLSVAGVVTRDDTPTVSGVMPGDRLVEVDSLDARSAPMGAVIDALRGTPGETRTLKLERQGEDIVVQATVLRLP